jgi:hypothetical protein
VARANAQVEKPEWVCGYVEGLLVCPVPARTVRRRAPGRADVTLMQIVEALLMQIVEALPGPT